MGFPQRRGPALGLVTPVAPPVSVVAALTGVQATTAVGSLGQSLTLSISGFGAVSALGFVAVPAVNAQAVADSFRVDLLNAKHAFGPSVIRPGTGADTFKAALYVTTGSLGAATTVYSATSEVSGSGYSAGGVAVTNAVQPTNTGSVAYWTPSASITFSSVTLATSFDALLLYNNTSAAKLAIAVITFTPQTVSAGTFTMQMPVNAATTALLRLT